jgi:hypothetical protein
MKVDTDAAAYTPTEEEDASTAEIIIQPHRNLMLVHHRHHHHHHHGYDYDYRQQNPNHHLPDDDLMASSHDEIEPLSSCDMLHSCFFHDDDFDGHDDNPGKVAITSNSKGGGGDDETNKACPSSATFSPGDTSRPKLLLHPKEVAAARDEADGCCSDISRVVSHEGDDGGRNHGRFSPFTMTLHYEEDGDDPASVDAATTHRRQFSSLPMHGLSIML